ncbi:MAG: hypothetical protein OEY11_02345 [Gammaproteobacteria bacterium]|nr:hypothetical protein [Gammaproteobacteria bacterium]
MIISIKSTIQFLILFISCLGIINISYADDNKYPAIFERGIIVKVDGKDYRLAGVADTDNGITDVPGHEWAVVDDEELVGRHYNTGPFGASNWWSSDASDGALLYAVRGIIDDWSIVKATEYYNNGFTHYHRLISMKTGLQHPNKVLWLSHAGVTDFSLDGGPHPEHYHIVTPGIDYRFVPNWQIQYGE